MSELSCAQCAELLPDVALDIADARDRAGVLAHVEQCRSCRDELATLSGVADRLYVLVPPVEPSHGFATRVVASISRRSRIEPRVPSPRRRYVRPLSVAAAVVLAAAVGVGGWLAAGGGSSGPSHAVETASFVAGHHTVGEMTMVPGARPWISVAVHLPRGTTHVRCEVENPNGTWRTIGTFHVYEGWGYWAAPLPRGMVVHGAELLTSSGHVLAKTSLTPA
jgi:hypothetical protein